MECKRHSTLTLQGSSDEFARLSEYLTRTSSQITNKAKLTVANNGDVEFIRGVVEEIDNQL